MDLQHRKLPAGDIRNRAGRAADLDIRAHFERAMGSARKREATGDRVEAERFYQQADHFRRLLNRTAA
ncbi:DUF4167 domain-containing protein [Bosea sp. TAF32]|uniref:DUF4167 domain-containing protein n=1 Tax=Bosea sp. TAF32 TaxID=3237482 RepID=UPI003F914FAB